MANQSQSGGLPSSINKEKKRKRERRVKTKQYELKSEIMIRNDELSMGGCDDRSRVMGLEAGTK